MDHSTSKVGLTFWKKYKNCFYELNIFTWMGHRHCLFACQIMRVKVFLMLTFRNALSFDFLKRYSTIFALCTAHTTGGHFTSITILLLNKLQMKHGEWKCYFHILIALLNIRPYKPLFGSRWRIGNGVYAKISIKFPHLFQKDWMKVFNFTV